MFAEEVLLRLPSTRGQVRLRTVAIVSYHKNITRDLVLWTAPIECPEWEWRRGPLRTMMNEVITLF